MNLHDFQAKWAKPPAHLTERGGAQSHFIDLCALFGVPQPTDDPSGDYTFEKGAQKLTDTPGFADVWKRNAFAWEYKRPGEDLRKAYQQLRFCLFAEDVGILPRGLFTRLLDFGAKVPAQFTEEATKLFVAMRDGGFFSMEAVPRFNGGLFAAIDVVSLTADELTRLAAAALDWGASSRRSSAPSSSARSIRASAASSGRITPGRRTSCASSILS